ncbi:hypothetical protein QBC47DRAFT_368756 [Echria macrotheca]|uniref:Oxidoreductase FAD/NAD(P)-binding domain-containing protein n=1 Tax=Echria macrotheca TaxID=438768 RepID=A0AAJ0BPH7_9PEZI|nr:hypothetical protein QBC47DRAFT_368756 [Echria macrotheca]
MGREEEGGEEVVRYRDVDIPVRRRRITLGDIKAVLGDDIDDAVVYICGVPTMTDDFVGGLVGELGMDPGRVLFEKWW